MQCDVCRKTIKDYSHFNDPKRGGKQGHCPLFDQSEERYEKEVSNAEAEMRKKVAEENPEVVRALSSAFRL
jgi:TRIAD3 protein (E3 ubiquitin-protein ligase RNF216)